jgi:hypothetical protein
MDVDLVTGTDRPDLIERVPDLLRSRWPRFLLDGHPGHDVDLTALVLGCLDHLILLVGPGDDLVGAGVSVPLHWDGTAEGLPSGWDGAVGAAAAYAADGGGTPDTVCALSATLRAGVKDRRLSDLILDGFKAAAARAGATAVIGPVRPVLKSRYPITPMDRYLTWRTPAGEVFDPWLHRHLAMGARWLGVAPESMTVTGTAAEWEEWLGMALPDSGSYVIPGGLEPLVLDRAADHGVYREANVWVAHPV